MFEYIINYSQYNACGGLGDRKSEIGVVRERREEVDGKQWK